MQSVVGLCVNNTHDSNINNMKLKKHMHTILSFSGSKSYHSSRFTGYHPSAEQLTIMGTMTKFHGNNFCGLIRTAL